MTTLPWQTTASVRTPQFSMHWLWALSNEMRLQIPRSSSSGASSSGTTARRAWSAACFFRTFPAPIIMRVACRETDVKNKTRSETSCRNWTIITSWRVLELLYVSFIGLGQHCVFTSGTVYEVCVCYLYAVEGSALLLVQQCVVVSQLHQLVQLFVGIFLLQLFQDTNHLEERQEDTSDICTKTHSDMAFLTNTESGVTSLMFICMQWNSDQISSVVWGCI